MGFLGCVIDPLVQFAFHALGIRDAFGEAIGVERLVIRNKVVDITLEADFAKGDLGPRNI